MDTLLFDSVVMPSTELRQHLGREREGEREEEGERESETWKDEPLFAKHSEIWIKRHEITVHIKARIHSGN